MNPLRLATAPEHHPYLDAVRPADVVSLRLGCAQSTPFAPSRVFDRDLVTAIKPDVVHVHFGFETVSPPRLARWANSVRQNGAALVVTVHDLRNPHELDRARHDAQLAVLLDAAHEVITLTDGAAAHIKRAWGRSATVLPHPTLMDSARTNDGADPQPAAQSLPVRRDHDRPVVGIHLKSLRTNVQEPAAVVIAAARGARRAGAILRVDVHPDVAQAAELAPVRAAHTRRELDLRVHERFSDVELVNYLTSLDVSVLPNRFGSHSGWLELCRDLATSLVVPDCGFYAEQWDKTTVYSHNETTGLDGESLADAVERAVRGGPVRSMDPAARTLQREAVRTAHSRIYATALARARAAPVGSGRAR